MSSSRSSSNRRTLRPYRLVGYENRLLRDEDFNDDKKDAGDLDAGHSVTALYEVVPAGARANLREVDKLKYQQTQVRTSAPTNEALTVKIRYKDPIGTRSKLITRVLAPAETDFAASSETLRFAAAVAQFGMLLRDSKHKGRGTFGRAIQLAQGALGTDEDGRRSEFVYLLKTARTLAEARQISQAVPPER